jgi:sulfotransferase
MEYKPSKQFVLLGGIPRSGSTLLCNILAQNPSIHATASSGCVDLLFGVRNAWDRLIEHKSAVDVEGNLRSKLRVMRAMLDAYHGGTEKPVIVDKSRGWIALLEMAEYVLGHRAKVIVPVRNVADVLSSFERLHRKQSAISQTPHEAENYYQFQTVEGRCEFWMRTDQPVGLAVSRVHDAIRRGYRDRLHFVPFDDLTAKPRDTLNKIYSFLKLPLFEHNFDHVEQVTEEDDSMHGFAGLHTIRSRVEPVESDWRRVIGDFGERYTAIAASWHQ